LPVLNDGGAAITDYELWVDQGTSGSTFSQLTNYVYSTYRLEYDIDPVVESFTLGKFYTFKYRARNMIDYSDYSNELIVPYVGAPDTPTSVTLVEATKTTIEVRWAAETSTNPPAGDIIGYKLYRDDGLGGSYSLIFDGTNYPLLRNHVSENLVTGRPYRWKHLVLNSAGPSDLFSNSVTFYTCEPPSGISSPRLISVGRTHVEISWTDPEDNGG
jgi:hypothetical protein